MEIQQPQSERMPCPRCGGEARFYLPYVMLFMGAEGISKFEDAMRHYPHQLTLEQLSDRQVVWYFPDLYGGPWRGWEARFGVCVCGQCGLRRKHDRMAKSRA